MGIWDYFPTLSLERLTLILHPRSDGQTQQNWEKEWPCGPGGTWPANRLTLALLLRNLRPKCLRFWKVMFSKGILYLASELRFRIWTDGMLTSVIWKYSKMCLFLGWSVSTKMKRICQSKRHLCLWVGSRAEGKELKPGTKCLTEGETGRELRRALLDGGRSVEPRRV